MAKLCLQITTACWILTANLANSEPANSGTLMEAITNNVRAVCQSPSDRGQHWLVKAKGDGGATIGLWLPNIANLSGKGEAEFTREEWEGVQQVLKEQQLDENKDYRACARALTPRFLEKFIPSSEAASVTSTHTSKGANPGSQISIGDQSPNINTSGDGDVNINFGD
ncbi:MAG: hypothetical protein ACREXR_03235 [Gammaproteobacteria bacterium]